MSSPTQGVSSRGRRRAASVTSQDTSQQQAHDDPSSSSQQPGGRAPSPSRAAQQPNGADAKLLSSSFGSGPYREPTRSYIHGSVRDHLAPVDSAQYARTVRQDTAELASYLLSDKTQGQSPAFLSRRRSSAAAEDAEAAGITRGSGTIEELPEPGPPEETDDQAPGPSGRLSILSSLFERSAPAPPPDIKPAPAPASPLSEDPVAADASEGSAVGEERSTIPAPWRMQPAREEVDGLSEDAPLLGPGGRAQQGYGMNGSEGHVDLESQKRRSSTGWLRALGDAASEAEGRVHRVVRVVSNPKRWDRKAIWQNVFVAPVVCLPAVIVGLLLNILDALSYGMILFPLGSPIFAHLGSAGISIFYVSTIISQLTFSSGSIFKGGVGSELIEIVPFFHSMAATITSMVGEGDADAVIATTITSYALSSMVTGLVFYLMGRFRFGYIVGFIPRHILIGCIGGVGWFLVATGFEVTSRMEGSLSYDLDTLQQLLRPDTVPLWIVPLVLAILLFCGQTRIPSKYFLPLYIIAIPCVFYFFVFALDPLAVDSLRDGGWIFKGPPADEPWWYFYTLYRFDKVHWAAIGRTVPAMFALTFFGILHVPINVPALALNTGEDNTDLDHELKLHGYSNFLSGCAGSIQNYLVYANTLFFIRSGGDSRLAGVILAAFTFGVMTIGPRIIGFIPVMMVGTLIFDLGFELLLEAVWRPRKKLKLPEYLTVIVIVLVMGIHDFVVGIGVGILLAFVSMIFQTSRVSAVRAHYSGEIVGSTVRRNPSQHHFLQQVGRQIYIIKLAGYLFFGTIVSVEDKIRELITDEAFSKRPIKYLVLDLWQVTGLDYSAGEAFNTISRLLDGRGIILVLSGVDAESDLGRNIRAVGLGGDGIDVMLLPDLNSALEGCENDLLKTFYASQEMVRMAARTAPAAAGLDVPGASSKMLPPSPAADVLGTSPRRSHLHAAAQKSWDEMDHMRLSRWQSFREPLRLMLQIFQDLSQKNEDFWFRAVPYFTRQEHPQGQVLFRRGEAATGFYLVESGILRAEYDLPQGWLSESIVAGTTCGELPFFSETERTATAVVEQACVVWRMDREGWERLQREEPEVVRELLRISLKLTSERMSVITSYILATAG